MDTTTQQSLAYQGPTGLYRPTAAGDMIVQGIVTFFLGGDLDRAYLAGRALPAGVQILSHAAWYERCELPQGQILRAPADGAEVRS